MGSCPSYWIDFIYTSSQFLRFVRWLCIARRGKASKLKTFLESFKNPDFVALWYDKTLKLNMPVVQNLKGRVFMWRLRKLRLKVDLFHLSTWYFKRHQLIYMKLFTSLTLTLHITSCVYSRWRKNLKSLTASLYYWVHR